MKIIFQEEDFNVEKNIKFFSESNKNAGSVFSFVGKVRPKNKNLKIKDIDIEFYEEMALYQMKKIINKLLKKYTILDYLVIHRFGKLNPGNNIVLILVASSHRKQSFRFTEELIDWLKIKITFWKKENYLRHSSWLEQNESDKKILDF